VIGGKVSSEFSRERNASKPQKIYSFRGDLDMML